MVSIVQTEEFGTPNTPEAFDSAELAAERLEGIVDLGYYLADCELELETWVDTDEVDLDALAERSREHEGDGRIVRAWTILIED